MVEMEGRDYGQEPKSRKFLQRVIENAPTIHSLFVMITPTIQRVDGC